MLALLGRFVDELASGLLVLLLPTLQARLGLSVGQVGWCLQALSTAGVVVEPATAAAVDVVERRPLLVWGAAGWAVALLAVAGASGYGWLLVAFAVAGAASGPLAQTTDVLLVELHPGAEERIGARQTMLDTAGALLAPAAVALVGWTGGDPRLALAATGCAVLVYAVLLAATPQPRPAGPRRRPFARMWANTREVWRDRDARVWLAALFGETLLDVPALFVPVWLAGDVGATPAQVALHAVVELATALAGLAVLDRALRRLDGRTILAVSCAASLAAYPVWLFAPGLTAKLLLVVPVTLAVTPVWPLVRARAFAAVPGRQGAVLCITSLFGVLPLAALLGWLGSRVGLGAGMLVMHTAATLLVLVVATRRRA